MTKQYRICTRRKEKGMKCFTIKINETQEKIEQNQNEAHLSVDSVQEMDKNTMKR